MQRRCIQMFDKIDKLALTHNSDDETLLLLIKNQDEEVNSYLFKKAEEVRQQVYGKDVYIRGLIEISNYCKNDCYYCGIRCSNSSADRYRLSKKDILLCAHEGYDLGFRTFVLQGGEDPYFTDEVLCDIVFSLKLDHPDCAVTLSMGERSRESYQALFDAGADRYLLRHETASRQHYEKLHPQKMSFDNRMRCLHDLKEIGYQTGCGFMVGSPYQTDEHLLGELKFLKQFEPHMCGIGPFIPHHDTPFADFSKGSLEMSLKLLALIRLLLPDVLLPSTTALGTIHPFGREKGILAGANVVMPNLSPVGVRKKYMLYDDKICTGDESAQCRKCLEGRINKTGYKIVTDRGDHKNI